MKEAGFFKRLWAEGLPFVARSPEMKVAWLKEAFKKNVLTSEEISPYMHLLLAEYDSTRSAVDFDASADSLKAIFNKLDRSVFARMLQCVEIYDLPVLLSLVDTLTVDEAVLALRITPPVYEKKPLLLIDKVFQAVNECGKDLLDKAAERMTQEGKVPGHFAASYERFKEILHDEQLLSRLYPHAQNRS